MVLSRRRKWKILGEGLSPYSWFANIGGSARLRFGFESRCTPGRYRRYDSKKLGRRKVLQMGFREIREN
jgi:hypothetical protein